MGIPIILNFPSGSVAPPRWVPTTIIVTPGTVDPVSSVTFPTSFPSLPAHEREAADRSNKRAYSDRTIGFIDNSFLFPQILKSFLYHRCGRRFLDEPERYAEINDPVLKADVPHADGLSFKREAADRRLDAVVMKGVDFFPEAA